MLKIKDNVDLKELEKFGFETFLIRNDKVVCAVRDSRNNSCKPHQYFRIGVNSEDRKFNKTKFRGGGKCLLTLQVTRKDVQDLIQAGLVEKVD
jgi:hypothetical protein